MPQPHPVPGPPIIRPKTISRFGSTMSCKLGHLQLVVSEEYSVGMPSQYICLEHYHQIMTMLVAGGGFHPPCNVETKSTLSPSCSSYLSSPSNSQSASLIRTRMPGRLYRARQSCTSPQDLLRLSDAIGMCDLHMTFQHK